MHSSRSVVDAGFQEPASVAELASTRRERISLAEYLREPRGWAPRDQTLSAVISISSNIAEGAGRGSDPDFCTLLWYSMGSANEFESDLLLGRNADLVP